MAENKCIRCGKTLRGTTSLCDKCAEAYRQEIVAQQGFLLYPEERNEQKAGE